jgi:uncharacterized protein with HEPN domain
MEKDPKIFLQHIIESIENIEDYTRNLSKGDFYDSVEKQDAVVRRLEIIGEAAKNLPEDFKKSHPEVSWHKAIGMRNVIVHEYFGIELDLVWDTATKILPDFKKQVRDLPEMPNS